MRAEALTLIVSGHYRQGASLLERVANPASALAAANAYAVAGDRPSALRLWKKATPNALLRLELAKSLYAQAVGPTSVDTARCEDAIMVIDEARTEFQMSRAVRRSATILLASIYDSLDKQEVAIRTIDEALADEAGDPDLEDQRAMLLYRSHDYDRAMLSAGTILTARSSWMAYLVRGLIEFERCNLERAKRDFNAGLSMPVSSDYRYSWLLLGLGQTLWASQDRAAAIETWRRYQLMQPRAGSVDTLIQAAYERERRRPCLSHL